MARRGVSDPGRRPLGVLLLAHQTAERPGHPPGLAHRPDLPGPQRVAAHLRVATGPSRARRRLGPGGQQEADTSDHCRAGHQRAPNPPKGNPKLLHRLTAEDLVNRDFQRHGPNQLWMTDLTEHPTQEGKLYCCVVLDAVSRSGRGLVPRPPTDRRSVNAALGKAVAGRKPAAGALVHSDHDSQYTSWTFGSGCGPPAWPTPSGPSATPSTTPWSSSSQHGCTRSC